MNKTKAILILVMFFSACGVRRPNVTEQQRDAMPLPEYPTPDENLGLRELGGQTSFQGSVLLWDPQVTPADVAEVAEASRQLRLKNAAYLRFVHDIEVPLIEQVKSLTAEIGDLRNQAQSGAAAQQRLAAETWFWDQLSEFESHNLVTSVDRNQADEVFGRYCEAKIWELASAKMLKNSVPTAQQTLWKTRPSPAVMCEVYYRAHGFLSAEVESCSPAASKGAVEKDFFNCLWEEGVFKTRFFAGQYDIPFEKAPNENKEAKLRAWVRDGSLEIILFKNDSNTSKAAAAMIKPAKVALARYMNFKNGSGQLVDNAKYLDIFVPRAGVFSASNGKDIGSAELKDFSPQYLINQIEDTTLRTTGALNDNQRMAVAAALVPNTDGDGGIDSAKDAVLVTLRSGISAMNRREAQEASVGDVVFGDAVSELRQPEKFEVRRQNTVLASVFSAIDPAIKARIEARLNDLKTLQAKRDEAAVKGQHLGEERDNTLTRGVNAAAKPGVGLALWTKTSLKVQRVGDVLDVQFAIDDSNAVLHGCWNVAKNIQVGCTAGSSLQLGERHMDAVIEYSREMRHLNLRTYVSTVDHLGLAERVVDGTVEARAGGFNNIEARNFQGLTMNVDLYGNALNGVDFFLGKVIFKKDDRQVYEAGVSLIPFGDTAQKEESRP